MNVGRHRALLQKASAGRNTQIFPMMLDHADDLGSSKSREAVHECDVDVDFGALAVWISLSDAFTERLEASHLRLDPASDMVAGSSLPVGASKASGRPRGFVARASSGAVLLPEPPVNGGHAAA